VSVKILEGLDTSSKSNNFKSSDILQANYITNKCQKIILNSSGSPFFKVIAQ